MELNQDILILKTIVTEYKAIWENPKKARALFMDYYPDDKPLWHALLSCIDLSIPEEITRLKCCSLTEYHRFVKRLTNVYGYLDELAGRAVTIWLNALDVTVEDRKKLNSQSDNKTSTNIEFVNEEYIGEYIGVSEYNERIIKYKDLWYAVIPFDIIKHCSMKVGTKMRFKAVLLGGQRYAYDIHICGVDDAENSKLQVAYSGEDVLRRTGVVETLESGRGIIYEKEIDQRYIFGLSKTVIEKKLMEGDKVRFILGVADGKLFATDIKSVSL